MRLRNKSFQKFLNSTSRVALCTASLTGAAIGFAASTPAAAQTAPAADTNSSTIETIVVTARFRKESEQKVGVTLNELDADKIRALNITSVNDLSHYTPLNITDRGPNQNAMNIRGIGDLQAVGTSVDPLPIPTAVGNYVDDVPINVLFGAQLDVRSFDLQNIEVLSGPQGTLYGESSEGGTIRYQTKDPDLDSFGGTLEVMGRSTEGGGSDISPRGAISIPIIQDEVGLRLVVDQENFAGFIDNTADGGKNVNHDHISNLHGVLLAKPNDKLTIRVAVTHEEGDLGALWAVTGDPSQLKIAAYPDKNDYIHDDYTLVSGKINYDFGLFALNSITGWFNRSTDRNLFDQTIGSILGTTTGRDVDKMRTNQFTQELRFISEWDSPIQFTGGLYYKDLTARIPYANFSIPNAFGPGITYELFENSSLVETGRQYAAYGEATWAITDNLKFIGGARYFNEKITAASTPGIFEGFNIPIIDKSVQVNTVLPKASLEYTPADNLLFYATYSTGAQNGNINSVATLALLEAVGVPVSTINAISTYKKDSVASYELGMKSRLFDDHLQANVAAFYTHWTDLQLPVDPGVGIALTTNVGSAHTDGVDVSLTYVPNDKWTFFATGDYVSAETDQAIQVRLVPPISYLPKGSPVPFAPDVKFALGGQFKDNIGDSNFQYSLRANYSYTGKYNNDTGTTTVANTKLGNYGLLNLGATLLRDGWSADFAVDNATNKTAIQTTIGAGTPGIPQLFFINAPRTYRLTLRYEF